MQYINHPRLCKVKSLALVLDQNGSCKVSFNIQFIFIQGDSKSHFHELGTF